MKRLLLTTLLLAAATAFGQISIGINIGPPPPPRVLAVRPVAPGPEFVWVDGYWYPQGRRYRWHEGYWTRAPFAGARWVAPRHENDRWFEGYWDGGREPFRHDHKWDRDRDRDWRRDHDRDRYHDRR
jgi:hypothetical protein